jgi:mono/diheme cytochrome c family protein
MEQSGLAQTLRSSCHADLRGAFNAVAFVMPVRRFQKGRGQIAPGENMKGDRKEYGGRSRQFILISLVTGAFLSMQCAPAYSGPQAGAAQTDWTAPEWSKATKNPVPPSPQVLSDAKDLFQNTCAPCHGVAGAGDGPASASIKPRPANLTNAKRMRAMTDGEIFWKISNGRGPMLAWSQIPEKDRWGLVDYIRTLAVNKPARKSAK